MINNTKSVSVHSLQQAHSSLVSTDTTTGWSAGLGQP